MKAAKIISFIAFFYNIFLTFSLFKVFLGVRLTFQKLEIQLPFPWLLFALPIFAIVNLSYWFYLKRKENKGEDVRFALWISLALLFIPIFIIVSLSSVSYIEPIYQLLRATE